MIRAQLPGLGEAGAQPTTSSTTTAISPRWSADVGGVAARCIAPRLTSTGASSILPAAHPMMEPTLSNVPDDLRYTTDHEYVARTGEAAVVRIGITDYAQGELGDVVFVNLPKPGDKFDGHQAFGTIEAVKAVSELYARSPARWSR